MFIKRILTVFAFGIAIFLSNSCITPAQSECADHWVYGEEPSDVYVRDSSIRWKQGESTVTATIIIVDRHYKDSRVFNNIYTYLNNGWNYRDADRSKNWSPVLSPMQRAILGYLMTFNK